MSDEQNLPVVQGETQQEEMDFPWLQQENEPDNWYRRFVKYYLNLGHGRTLLKAMSLFLQTEHPERYARFLENPRQSASAEWSTTASAWQWRERARIYDMASMQEAMEKVGEARKILIESTPKAAKALVESLENPRTRVNAAKEILDRGGLPGTIVHEERVVPFTADELSQAQTELETWEQRLNLKSGENG